MAGLQQKPGLFGSGGTWIHRWAGRAMLSLLIPIVLGCGASPPRPVPEGFYRVEELDTVFFADFNLIGLRSANDSLYWAVSPKRTKASEQTPFKRDTVLVIGGEYRLSLDKSDSTIPLRTWIEDWSGDYFSRGVQVIADSVPLVDLLMSQDLYDTRVRYDVVRGIGKDEPGAR